MTDADHDAVLRIFDATDRLGKKLVAWKWADGRPTMSPDEHAESKRLITEAEDRVDPDDFEHGTVLARIWMDGESVSRIEWCDR